MQAWRDIWATGRVDIKGEPETAKVTYASLYYILSSIPVTNDTDLSFVGLSPGDLAHGAYLQVRSFLLKETLSFEFLSLPNLLST